MPFETRRGNVLDAHRAVVTESPTFHNDTWGHISSGAVDLVKRMLIKDPKKRISIVEILKNDWIVNRADLSEERKVLSNKDHLAKLQGRRRFLKAAMLVKWAGRHARTREMIEKSLQNHLSDVDEAALIRLRDSVVTSLDMMKTYDLQHFKTACFNAGEPWKSLRLDQVFEKFDLDNNKKLEWHEILLGFLNLLPKSPMKLRACFVLLDRDGSGDLGPEELRKLFESSLREDDVNVLRKLRHAMESLNVDEKSGTVTFDSFRCMIEHDEMLRNLFLGASSELNAVSTPSKFEAAEGGEKKFKFDGTPISVMTQTDSEDENGI